jgi:hypothetical protein
MRNFFKFILSFLLLTIFVAVVIHFYPTSIPLTGGLIVEIDSEEIIPSFEEFKQQVTTGEENIITGIYIEDLFAFPVIQQPAGKPTFVSGVDQELTQFSLATSYGSLGFLAHNTLAGVEFFRITIDNLIYVIYGDGYHATYRVFGIRRFQAVTPSSPYSFFIDLLDGSTLTALDLFEETYKVPGNLILQTCIAQNEEDNWGRLFIIAKQYEESIPLQLFHLGDVEGY